MRLIDADETRRNLCAYSKKIHNHSINTVSKFGKDMFEITEHAIQGCINIVNCTPTANEWIPVSERLPSDDAEVLVSVYFMGLKQTHKNGWNDHIKPHCYVDIARYDEGEWLSYSDEYKVARKRHKVIAWMELPKPYEVEK